MIGELISGRYRVLKSMSRRRRHDASFLYECQDEELHRPVVIKLFPGAAFEPKERDRFENEGRLLASIHHPHVVQILDTGLHQDTPFLVMEHLEGDSLADRWSTTAVAPVSIVNIMKELASGLVAVHAAGILHRNLSLDTVRVTPTGTVKLSGFGLAVNFNSLSARTRNGLPMDSRIALAPEQIRGEAEGPASDVFAFGMLLHEALAGSPPFSGEHAMSVLFNIADQPPTSLGEAKPELPSVVLKLVERCLRKSPAERPTLEEVAELLEQAGRELTSSGSETPELLKARPETSTHQTDPEALSPTPAPASPSNPYLNRGMLRYRQDFMGRKRELRQIFSSMNSKASQCLAVVGDRRIGKSSLLNHVYMWPTREEHLREPEATVCVLLDLQQKKDMSVESFFSMLLDAVRAEVKALVDKAGKRRSLKLLREPPTPTFDGVKEAVTELNETGLRLVVLMDEFEAVTQNSAFNAVFFGNLRHLATFHNVCWLTSSVREIQTLCHTQEIADSPFFNIFSTIPLRPFPIGEAKQLIAELSREAGVPLEPYQNEILNLSGRFPMLLQIACATTFDYLEEEGGGKPDFSIIRRRFLDEAESHFRFTWSTLHKDQKRVLGMIERGEAIPAPLQHLQEGMALRGLLETPDSGPVLFSEPFQSFVTQQTDSRRAKTTTPPRKLERWKVGAVTLGMMVVTLVGILAVVGKPDKDETPADATGPSIAQAKVIPVESRGSALALPHRFFEIRARVEDASGVDSVLADGEPMTTKQDALYNAQISVPDEQKQILLEAWDKLGNRSERRLVVASLAGGRGSLERNGRDYALLIAGDEYEHLKELSNPILDATTLGETLTENYGFEVEQVNNPTKDELYAVLNQYKSRRFLPDDQLLVFLAGHGEYNDLENFGYVACRDSKRPVDDINHQSYISHHKFFAMANVIQCDHILVAIDICFGGVLFTENKTRGASADENSLYATLSAEELVQRKMRYRSRLFITSTTNTEVADGVPGGHSPFAKELLDVLRRLDQKVLTAGHIIEKLEYLSTEPKMGPFGDNEPGGDFLFIVETTSESASSKP